MRNGQCHSCTAPYCKYIGLAIYSFIIILLLFFNIFSQCLVYYLLLLITSSYFCSVCCCWDTAFLIYIYFSPLPDNKHIFYSYLLILDVRTIFCVVVWEMWLVFTYHVAPPTGQLEDWQAGVQPKNDRQKPGGEGGGGSSGWKLQKRVI